MPLSHCRGATRAWYELCSQIRVAGVRRFQDLIAWQLAMELNDVVFEITDAGPPARDAEFRAQIRNAASAAPPLIAEGFLRFTPAEFIRYLRMARGEVGEVQTHLEIGRRRNYFAPEQLSRACPLADRTMTTITNLLKSKLKATKRRSRKDARQPT